MIYSSYLRVSTQKQGQSGLGLEAQRQAVRAHLCRDPDFEFVEVESGKTADRPQLQRALDHTELTKGTLIVAKLDRLSRDLAFLTTLQRSKVHKIVFADMPEASREMITFMAFLAQWERERISERTRSALSVAKDRGVKLGGDRGNLAQEASKGTRASTIVRSSAAKDRAAKVMPYIVEARSSGRSSLRQIADYLNGRGLKTVRGNPFSSTAVANIIRGS